MKGKRNGRRFNLVDVALIVLVLFAVIGVWQRENLKTLFTTEQVLDEYVVTFEVKKLRSTTGELLKKGTVFTVVEDGERMVLGTLSRDVAASAATENLRDKDGNVVSVVYPEDEYEYLWDVSGELHCEGIERDGTFLVGGDLYLARNKRVLVQTETADFEIVVKSIEKAS